MVIIVTMEAKYNLFSPAFQFYHPSASSSSTRLTGLVTITIIILYHINYHYMLSTYHNYEKTDKFKLSALLLPLCCFSVLLAAIENPWLSSISLTFNVLIHSFSRL